MSTGKIIIMLTNAMFSYVRIYIVSSLLPGANCSSCGADDCKTFARMIINDKVEVAQCVMCDTYMIGKIEEYLHRK